jgi:hypothetical protein
VVKLKGYEPWFFQVIDEFKGDDDFVPKVWQHANIMTTTKMVTMT